MDVVDFPNKRIPFTITVQQMQNEPQPPDADIFALCAYMRSEPCMGCPEWDAELFHGEKTQRLCRGLAEEHIRVLGAIRRQNATPSPNIRHDPGLESGETGE